MTRDARARQILDIAEAVFAEQGITGASMEAIADRAGVTKPVLYDHFGSKDGLLAAVIERAGRELWEATLAAIDGVRESEALLARGLRAYFVFIRRHGRAWSALLTESAALSGPAVDALEAIRRRQGRLIADVLLATLPGCDAGRAEIYAEAVVGACERLSVHGTGDEVSPDDLTRHLMDLIWTGFGRLTAGERWQEE